MSLQIQSEEIVICQGFALLSLPPPQINLSHPVACTEFQLNLKRGTDTCIKLMNKNPVYQLVKSN